MVLKGERSLGADRTLSTLWEEQVLLRLVCWHLATLHISQISILQSPRLLKSVILQSVELLSFVIFISHMLSSTSSLSFPICFTIFKKHDFFFFCHVLCLLWTLHHSVWTLSLQQNKYSQHVCRMRQKVQSWSSELLVYWLEWLFGCNLKINWQILAAGTDVMWLLWLFSQRFRTWLCSVEKNQPTVQTAAEWCWRVTLVFRSS